jgi:hypothetical protein
MLICLGHGEGKRRNVVISCQHWGMLFNEKPGKKKQEFTSVVDSKQHIGVYQTFGRGWRNGKQEWIEFIY